MHTMPASSCSVIFRLRTCPSRLPLVLPSLPALSRRRPREASDKQLGDILLKTRGFSHFICGAFLRGPIWMPNGGLQTSSTNPLSAFTGTNLSNAKAHRLTLLLLALLLAILNLGCSGIVEANPTSNGHPSIITQPTGQTVTAGQAATFTVAATGRGTLNYQWRKNGTAISGATSPNYTTAATTSSDSGAQFTVLVSNTMGGVTSNAATLTVNSATVAPAIITQPSGQTLTAGQTASFSVVATGTAPLSYQWQKNGAAISAATSFSYATPATTSSDNGAQFTVGVSNAAGSVTSNVATLTVNAAPVAPAITIQPTSQTVSAGQTASFSVVATGTAPLSYQWQKNGANVTGATAANYTTPATTISDSGSTFRVVVNNATGTITSVAATLTVNAAPVAPSITAQPTSQTVTAGQTASFSVAATGTAPLSYQWQKNGVAISAATSSSYTTPATTSSDNGAQFTVSISNTAGSVTSSAATLTV